MGTSVVGVVLADIITVAIVLLFVRFVLDLVLAFARSFRPSGGAAVLFELVYSVTDPPLRALRRVIPGVRLGSVTLDVSFIVLLIALSLVRTAAYQL